jgi:hypothetical protein
MQLKFIGLCFFLMVGLQKTYGQNWFLTGNGSTNSPAIPAIYGTSTIGSTEH